MNFFKGYTVLDRRAQHFRTNSHQTQDCEVSDTRAQAKFLFAMDTFYYVKVVRPTLTRKFKHMYNAQQLRNEQTSLTIDQATDPVKILEYLSNSEHATSEKESVLIKGMIADIEEIASQVNYYSTKGASIQSVTSSFYRLMCSLKMREQADRNRQINILGTDGEVKQFPANDKVAKNDKKAMEGKRVAFGMNHSNSTGQQKGEKEQDADWEILEEEDIHDFIVVEKPFEL